MKMEMLSLGFVLFQLMYKFQMKMFHCCGVCCSWFVLWLDGSGHTQPFSGGEWFERVDGGCGWIQRSLTCLHYSRTGSVPMVPTGISSAGTVISHFCWNGNEEILWGISPPASPALMTVQSQRLSSAVRLWKGRSQPSSFHISQNVKGSFLQTHRIINQWGWGGCSEINTKLKWLH